MRQLSFSYCFMRDSVLLLNEDICVELFTLGLNDAVIRSTLIQLIASLLKFKLGQIDLRCILFNILIIDKISKLTAVELLGAFVIPDHNLLRRLCRCLFLQIDSNCAILFNIVVLLCAIVVSSYIGRNVCLDGFVGDIGSQTIDRDLDRLTIDRLNPDHVVDMHSLIRYTRGRLVRHVGAASQNTGSSNSQSSDTCALQELTTPAPFRN